MNKTFYPPSYGPGSYRGLPKELVEIYSRVPTQTEEAPAPPPSQEPERKELEVVAG